MKKIFLLLIALASSMFARSAAADVNLGRLQQQTSPDRISALSDGTGTCIQSKFSNLKVIKAQISGLNQIEKEELIEELIKSIEQVENQ